MVTKNGPSANGLVRLISLYVQDPLYCPAAEEILRGYRRLAEPFDWIWPVCFNPPDLGVVISGMLGPGQVGFGAVPRGRVARLSDDGTGCFSFSRASCLTLRRCLSST